MGHRSNQKDLTDQNIGQAIAPETGTVNEQLSNILTELLQKTEPADSQDVDVLSQIPGTGATNLGKAIDTAFGGTDTGVAILAVRDDTLSSLTPAEGDWVPLRTSSTGALHVTGGGGGSEPTDDTSTHSTGSSVGTSVMAVATPTDSAVDANDFGHVAMSLDRRLHVDADITASVGLTVDLGANNDVTLNANSGVDIGDVDVTSIAAGDNNIGNVDIVSLPASTNTLEVVGDVAHDAAAAGNPVLICGIASDVDSTAPANRISTEADATTLTTDFDGVLFVRPHGIQITDYHVNGSSALTDTAVFADPGDGLSIYVTDIVVSSGAATAMNIFFEEGATTVLGPWYLEAVAGRGFSIHFQTPKKITASTALTVTTSAAIAHTIDVTGYIAQG